LRRYGQQTIEDKQSAVRTSLLCGGPKGLSGVSSLATGFLIVAEKGSEDMFVVYGLYAINVLTGLIATIAYVTGVIALIFGNSERGAELIKGGVFWTIVSVVLISLAFGLAHLINRAEDGTENTQQPLNNSQARYDQLLETLNMIKKGTAKTSQKIAISKKLVSNAGLPEQNTQDLLEQIDMEYKTGSSV
jgi:hypothetical protein